MIKLVASDIDGTLVKDGYHTLNPRIPELIHELKEKGIIFVAASGRQYSSMKHLFRDVKDDVIFVAENGAYVVCRDWEIDEHHFNPQIAEALIKDIRETDDCHLTVSANDKLYVETEDEHLLDLLINGYKNDVVITDDVLALNLPINKVSMYRREGIDEIAEKMVAKWEDKLNCSLAGGRWLDFMEINVDKGIALAEIQEILKINIDETMAFGDNINDIGMLKRAGESYAVANARKEVKAVAKHIAESNLNNGVIKVLETLV